MGTEMGRCGLDGLGAMGMDRKVVDNGVVLCKKVPNSNTFAKYYFCFRSFNLSRQPCQTCQILQERVQYLFVRGYNLNVFKAAAGLYDLVFALFIFLCNHLLFLCFL